MEYGLRQEGVLSFVRELDGNDEEAYESYLKDASLYARGMYFVYLDNCQLAMICGMIIRGYS